MESFTLAEIKSLDAGSWFGPEFKGAQMLTFQETIDLVKGKAGLFPELKFPARFRAKGFDPEQMVTDVLRKNGLVGAMVKGRPAVHMQVFEEDSREAVQLAAVRTALEMLRERLLERPR